MDLHADPEVQVSRELLERLVRAGFGAVADDDVEVRLRPAGATLRRWIQLCRDPQGCARPTNYEQAGGVGHCAASRSGVAALAGDPTAHRAARAVEVVARYPYTGRVRDRRRHGTATGPRFLVSLQVPADPDDSREGYPRTSRDPRPANAPALRINDWTEDLVRLAAHEARHVDQHRRGVPRSELDAEGWAASRLDAYRRALTSGRAIPAPLPGTAGSGLDLPARGRPR